MAINLNVPNVDISSGVNFIKECKKINDEEFVSKKVSISIPTTISRAFVQIPIVDKVPAKYPNEFSWSLRKIAKVVLYVTIFPIGLLWLINKIICIGLWTLGNKIVSCLTNGKHKSLIDSVILPALAWSDEAKKQEAKIAKKFAFENTPSCSLKLTTPDGVELDGAILWADGKNFTLLESPERKSSKWIVFYNGNGMFYEDALLRIRYDYPEEVYKNYNIIMFNYRGVGESKGCPQSASDLFLDGHTPVAYLKGLGVPEENIYLEGMSLGGAIAAQVGAYNPKVNVANIRSFSNISQFVYANFYHGMTNNNWGKCSATIIAWLISAIVGHIFSTMNCEMNSAEAWSKIMGKKRIETAEGDEMMIGKGRLAEYLGLQNDPCHLQYPGDHNGPVSPQVVQKRLAHFR